MEQACKRILGAWLCSASCLLVLWPAAGVPQLVCGNLTLYVGYPEVGPLGGDQD